MAFDPSYYYSWNQFRNWPECPDPPQAPLAWQASTPLLSMPPLADGLEKFRTSNDFVIQPSSLQPSPNSSISTQEWSQEEQANMLPLSREPTTQKRPIPQPCEAVDLTDPEGVEHISNTFKRPRFDTSASFKVHLTNSPTVNFDENSLLLKLVDGQAPEAVNWKKIAGEIGKPLEKLQTSYILLKSQAYPLKSDWTPEEKKKLEKGVKKCKFQWKLISALFFNGFRTALDCRKQWRNEVNPALIKTPWTDEDQTKLEAFIKTQKVHNFLIYNTYNHFETKRSWKLLKNKIKNLGVNNTKK